MQGIRLQGQDRARGRCHPGVARPVQYSRGGGGDLQRETKQSNWARKHRNRDIPGLPVSRIQPAHHSVETAPPGKFSGTTKQGCCRPTTWKQHLGFWACRGSLESGRGYEPGRDRRSHRSSSTRQARSLQHRQHVRGLNPATAAEASREETTGRAPGSAGVFREESRGFENGRRSGPALASTGGCPGRCRPNNPRPPYRGPHRGRWMHPGEPASRGSPGLFSCRIPAARCASLRRRRPASLPAFSPSPAAAPVLAAPEPVPTPRGSSPAA